MALRRLVARRNQRKAEAKKRTLIRGLGEVELTPLSGPVLSALDLLRTDKALATVGETLAADPSCTLRTLRLTNSSSSGLRRPVESVPHAAALLGREKLEVILVAAALSASLPSPTTKSFDPAMFWHLAATRASLARELAAHLSTVAQMTTFTIALLQDLAVPMLIAAHGERYDDIFAQWRADGGSLGALEREAFGIDHSEIGAELASVWKLPQKLCDGIGSHHHNSASAPVSLVASLRPASDGSNLDSNEVDALIVRAGEEFAIAADDTCQMIERASLAADDLVKALT